MQRKQYQVRLSDEEVATFERAARAKGKTVSAWLRDLGREEAGMNTQEAKTRQVNGTNYNDIEFVISSAIEDGCHIVVEVTGEEVEVFRSLTIEHAVSLDPNSAEFDPHIPAQIDELRWVCGQVFSR